MPLLTLKSIVIYIFSERVVPPNKQSSMIFLNLILALMRCSGFHVFILINIVARIRRLAMRACCLWVALSVNEPQFGWQ